MRNAKMNLIPNNTERRKAEFHLKELLKIQK